jgi:hypothetical protein
LPLALLPVHIALQNDISTNQGLCNPHGGYFFCNQAPACTGPSLKLEYFVLATVQGFLTVVNRFILNTMQIYGDGFCGAIPQSGYGIIFPQMAMGW